MGMTRRDRLMATLRGEQVDRPAVSFYEIGGWRIDPKDSDPYNVYNGPGWAPLVELAEKRTDLMRLMDPERAGPAKERFFHVEVREEGESRFTRTTLKVGGRRMTEVRRQDRDVATVWTLEPLLKDPGDVDAFLALPDEAFRCGYDLGPLHAEEVHLGDAGIVVVNMHDPLCHAAKLFSMEDYTILAMTDPFRFHRLLERFARPLLEVTRRIAAEFPGRLWRIVGPEYASEPFLPPRLFREYVVGYTGPMVKAIREKGGFARIHTHGKMKNILPLLRGMEVDGIDPIEPPPQGDVSLREVREGYGKQMVLFGNLEAVEVEREEPERFERRVKGAIEEGTSGVGRGFVLMPSGAPYGRTVSERTLANYRTMVRLAEGARPPESPRSRSCFET